MPDTAAALSARALKHTERTIIDWRQDINLRPHCPASSLQIDHRERLVGAELQLETRLP